MQVGGGCGERPHHDPERLGLPTGVEELNKIEHDGAAVVRHQLVVPYPARPQLLSDAVPLVPFACCRGIRDKALLDVYVLYLHHCST